MELRTDPVNGHQVYNPEQLPSVSIHVVFLFYCTKDLSRFITTRKRLLSAELFLILGNCPEPAEIVALKEHYANARFRTAFGPSLISIVLTCRISLWLRRLDASFRLTPESLICQYKGSNFFFEPDSFSLHKFCRATGFRTNVRQERMHDNLLL